MYPKSIILRLSPLRFLTTSTHRIISPNANPVVVKSNQPLSVRMLSTNESLMENKNQILGFSNNTESKNNSVSTTRISSLQSEALRQWVIFTTAFSSMISKAYADSVNVSTAATSLPLVSPLVVSFLKVAPPIASQLCFFAPMQAMRQIKSNKSTGDLPLLPYSAMAVSGLIWMTYGVLMKDLTIFLPNVTGSLLGFYYWNTFRQYAPSTASFTPHYFGAILIMTAIWSCASTLPTETALYFTGTTGCALVVAMFGGPLAAISTVIKEKNTSSLPLAFTLATFLNCTLWSAYGGLVIHDSFIWGPNLLGLASSTIQLGLFARYGVQTRSNKDKASDIEMSQLRK